MTRRLHYRSLVLCSISVIVLLFGVFVRFDTHAASVRAIAPVPAATPVYSGYKGVQIGMTDAETRKLLGDPKEKNDGQDYFVFSEKESAQVMYDSDHKVTTISVTYLGKSSSIPTPTAVFGEDVAAKPDGSISKTVQYAKDGYSVSYYKTPGDDPIVMVTVQKIPVASGS